jgi:hypothetical protein
MWTSEVVKERHRAGVSLNCCGKPCLCVGQRCRSAAVEVLRHARLVEWWGVGGCRRLGCNLKGAAIVGEGGVGAANKGWLCVQGKRVRRCCCQFISWKGQGRAFFKHVRGGAYSTEYPR